MDYIRAVILGCLRKDRTLGAFEFFGAIQLVFGVVMLGVIIFPLMPLALWMSYCAYKSRLVGAGFGTKSAHWAPAGLAVFYVCGFLMLLGGEAAVGMPDVFRRLFGVAMFGGFALTLMLFTILALHNPVKTDQGGR